jgi:uncharacterized LabA/DUF88 family protein
MDKERVMIFIDGSNLYHNLKNLGVSNISFEKLVKLLLKERELISVQYYNAPLDISINPNKYWIQQRFYNSLKQIQKFNVILCRLKKHKRIDGSFEFEVKGDDVHLATDLISNAYENQYDTAIIVSGDEDFVPAIKQIQRLNKKTENIYFNFSSAAYLRNNCNNSLCITRKILEKIKN